MPVEAKPLFRPDVLRAYLNAFSLPAHVEAFRPKLAKWADLLASGKAGALKEQEILPDFLTDFFCELLGYTRPADGHARYTISREEVALIWQTAPRACRSMGRCESSAPKVRLIPA